MLNLVDAEGDCLKLLAWSTNISMQAGGTDPRSNKECWAVPAHEGRAPPDAAQSPHRRREQCNAMETGGGTSSPSAQLSQTNPLCINNSTLQICLLNKETLSSYSSHLNQEMQIHGSTFCQRCSRLHSHGQSSRNSKQKIPPYSKKL